MKKLILLIIFLFVGCATCPNQDIVVPVYMRNGQNALIFLKKGSLDNPKNYITKDEFKKMLGE